MLNIIYSVSLLNIIYSACCVESWVFSFAFWLGYSTLVSVNIVFYSVSYLNVFTVLHWLNIVYSACCVESWVFSFAFWLGYSNSALNPVGGFVCLKEPQVLVTNSRSQCVSVYFDTWSHRKRIRQKGRQRSSLLVGGQHLFHSMPHYSHLVPG